MIFYLCISPNVFTICHVRYCRQRAHCSEQTARGCFQKRSLPLCYVAPLTEIVATFVHYELTPGSCVVSGLSSSPGTRSLWAPPQVSVIRDSHCFLYSDHFTRCQRGSDLHKFSDDTQLSHSASGADVDFLVKQTEQCFKHVRLPWIPANSVTPKGGRGCLMPQPPSVWNLRAVI